VEVCKDSHAFFVTATGHSTEISELISLGNQTQLCPHSSETRTDSGFSHCWH